MHFKDSIFPAPLLLLISAALLTLLYLLGNSPGKWGSQAPQTIVGSSFSLARGVGRVEGGALLVQETGVDGIAIAAYQSHGVRAQDYPQLKFNISSTASPPEVLLLWRTADNPGATFTRRLQWQGNQIASIPMAQEPDWQGEIIGLAVVIRGAMSAPLVIQSMTLQPINAATVLTDLADGWLRFEPWHGGSINFIYGGSQDAILPAVSAAGLVMLLAVFIYFIWTKWRHQVFNPGVIAALVALTWLLVDLRWQANLFTQLAQTRERYAGKNWLEKHRAAEDGDLFDFVQAIKTKLGPRPSRVLVFSDFDYFRGRAAYHLYPHNVYYQIKDATLPPAQTIRAGEYLVLYQKRGVQYHPGKKELLWNGQPISVEPILFSKGNAFFKVR